jgi:hypothetical protein
VTDTPLLAAGSFIVSRQIEEDIKIEVTKESFKFYRGNPDSVNFYLVGLDREDYYFVKSSDN